MQGAHGHFGRILVAEIMEVLGEIRPPVGCEIQLFGYFPILKMQTLFGSVLINQDLPQSVTPLGPTRLLEIEDLPEDKFFYVYAVIRLPTEAGIIYRYVFPTDDYENDIVEVDLEGPDDGSRVLAVEAKILNYAMEWADVVAE